MDIVLVRHAESIWNAEGRWQGQSDVPLSAQGRGEAARLGARLAPLAFDHRVCSDLSRTRETAAAIGGAFELDPVWREMDLGAWGGLLHGEVLERFPEDLEAMISGSSERAIGGGESMPRFEARAGAALDALVARCRPGERALVVTHGGVIRAIVMRLLGLRGRPLVGATNTSLTHLRVEGGRAQLVAYNCGAHLEDLASGGDEIVEGAPDEVVRRTAARLGLDPEAHDRFHPPAPGSITRVLTGSGQPALRSYATPALAPRAARDA